LRGRAAGMENADLLDGRRVRREDRVNAERGCDRATVYHG
jgi:hypothetical protein